MIGTLLDQRYQVVEVLGQGGFGHTYIAQDTRRPGNPTCVVKHLKPAAGDPDFLQIARRLFNSEAETLEKLGTHDQIPRLLAYFEENHEFYLVEEFVAGHPLSAELPPGQQWNESQVIQLLSEVLSILEFVHTNGVIHRDLKPDNLIRRTSDNKLVLVDFGAVKQIQMHSIVAQETVDKTVAIGTPGYMPSEQGQGRPRPSSDLYALGMIGIQALTGLNPMQLSENTQTGEIIWRHQAQVSDNLAAILNKMVRHYFKHRYQSATEALQAVNSLTHSKTPMAVAAALSQKGHSYLKSGYQSASETLRSLASLAKTYISQNNATSLPSGTPENTVTMPPAHLSNSPNASQAMPGSVFKGRYKLPLLIGVGTATVVVAIGAISAMRQPPPSPKTAQNTTELKETKPEQADTAKQATQPTNTAQSPNPTQPTNTVQSPNPTQPTNPAQPTNPTQPNNNCIVVVKSSNVRSISGRGKTKEVVKAGTPVSVTGQEEGGWIEINSPVSGWIWKNRTKNTCSSR